MGIGDRPAIIAAYEPTDSSEVQNCVRVRVRGADGDRASRVRIGDGRSDELRGVVINEIQYAYVLADKPTYSRTRKRRYALTEVNAYIADGIGIGDRTPKVGDTE